jgi:hypothetical protein
MSITDTIEAINELPDKFEGDDTVIISFGPGTYTSKEIPVASLKELATAYTELKVAAESVAYDYLTTGGVPNVLLQSLAQTIVSKQGDLEAGDINWRD